MKVVRCQHCHTGIVPTSDNRCPACLRDLADYSGVDPTKAALEVEHHEDLPTYCSWCDRYTDDQRKIVRKGEFKTDAKENELAILVVKLALPFFNWMGFSSGERSTTTTIEVQASIPLCVACRSHGREIEVLHADLLQRRLTLLVGKEFAQRCLAQRARQRPRGPKRWRPRKSKNDWSSST